MTLTLINLINMIEIVINENDGGQRFDRFLRKYFENAPLSLIQKNIRKKNFKINDKRAKKDDFVYPGDSVKMYINDSDYDKWLTRTDFKAQDFNLDIVYEDDNIIIMDKREGLLTHSSSIKDYGNNLVDNMLAYLYKTKSIDMTDKIFKPAVVNRLDRNTAGLVIGAKNAKALRSLNRAIRNKYIDKYYMTIVNGHIDKDFSIRTTIAKNENKNRIRKSEDGKEIITHFRPLDSNKKFTLLECKLETGKTHQIRFSLKENGTPIIGDRKYGSVNSNRKLEKFGIHNQVLLAYKLSFKKFDGLEYLENKEFYSSRKNSILELKDRIFKEIWWLK